MLIILSCGMIIPVIIGLQSDTNNWQAFAGSSLITFFIGGGTFMAARTGQTSLSNREAFLLTTLSWTILPIFASLPFMTSNLNLTFTDAFFEAMSGITTTGATVLTNLDNISTSLLVWRGILQWMGGLGIIIMAITILPMLKVGGMQMFKVEGFDTQDKVLPRATQLAAALMLIFSGLTCIWALLYWVSGMSSIDALVHAMTTIATGGYSNHDLSIGHYNSLAIELVAALGMLAGSIPFLLYIQALRGRPLLIWKDTQVKGFLATVVFFIFIMSIFLFSAYDNSIGQSLRFATFNVISIITGTGYTSTDFNAWGGVSSVIFFVLMFVGGCAGSTTCGIKIFRFQILFETIKIQLRQLLQPHGTFVPYFNNRPINESIAASVMGFFYLYALTVCLLAIALAFIGLDFITALSGAASAVSNVGPGLGTTIGPSSTYAVLPDSAKWLLSIGMLLGRLELYTVLVVFLPQFWRS
ncbi:MAG: potassium transporter TrkH [Rhodospirillaceae bacterium]|nr:potassium transporter TrkH [Rhodospirillaceae bacterium]